MMLVLSILLALAPLAGTSADGSRRRSVGGGVHGTDPDLLIPIHRFAERCAKR